MTTERCGGCEGAEEIFNLCHRCAVAWEQEQRHAAARAEEAADAEAAWFQSDAEGNL